MAIARALVLVGLGIPGPRTLAVIAAVALALYGRSGARLLMMTKYGRGAGPWVQLLQAAVSPPSARRGKPPAPAAPARNAWGWRRRGWFFWAAVIAFAAVATIIVATRIAVHNAAGLPR